MTVYVAISTFFSVGSYIKVFIKIQLTDSHQTHHLNMKQTNQVIYETPLQ